MKTITPNNNEFNFTFPIAKSFTTEGDSPKMIIKGVASNTNRDKQGERFTREGLLSIQKAIEEGIVDEDGEWSRVPLLSGHRPEWDDVLGYITKAEIDEQDNLWITAELDEDSAGAQTLYRKISKSNGKKLGLSVRGSVTKYHFRYDDEIQKSVPHFDHMIVREVSVTQKPVNPTPYPLAIAKSLLADPAYQQGMEECMVNNDLSTEMNTINNDDAIGKALIAAQAARQEAPIEASKAETEVIAEGVITEATTSDAVAQEQEAVEEVTISEAVTNEPKAADGSFVDMFNQLKDLVAGLAGNVAQLQAAYGVQKAETVDETPAESVVPAVAAEVSIDERIAIGVSKALTELNLGGLVTDMAAVKHSVEAIESQPNDRSISISKAKSDEDQNDPFVKMRALRERGIDPLTAAVEAAYANKNLPLN